MAGEEDEPGCRRRLCIVFFVTLLRILLKCSGPGLGVSKPRFDFAFAFCGISAKAERFAALAENTTFVLLCGEAADKRPFAGPFIAATLSGLFAAKRLVLT